MNFKDFWKRFKIISRDAWWQRVVFLSGPRGILPTSLLSQLKGYWRHTYLWTVWPVDSPQFAKKLFGAGVSICALI